MAVAWRVFVILWALYLLSYGGGPHAVDEIGQLGVTASLVKRGSLDADELFWTIPAAGNRSDAQVEIGPTGDVWSVRGPALPAAMAPWYGLAFLWPRLDVTFTALLAMSVVSAATGGLLAYLGLQLGLSPRAAAAGGLLYGVTGMAWPYARLGFGEPLIGLAIVAAAVAAGVGRSVQGENGGGHVGTGGRAHLAGPALAGAFVALAAATKWSAAALGVPFAAYVALTESDAPALTSLGLAPRRAIAWRSFGPALRRLVALSAVCGVGLVLLGWHNWAHFGSPFATGYGLAGREEFTTAPLYGLSGLLVSAYRGIVWFTPTVAVGAVLLIVAFRRAPAFAVLALSVALVTLATFAGWWTWWGGYTWGPRFLLPACPLLVLGIPLAWPRLGRVARRLVIALVGLSLLIQLPGVLVDFNPFERTLRAARPDFPRSGGIWGVDASPIAAHLSRLAADGTCAVDLAWLRCGYVDRTLALLLLLPLALAFAALWRRRRLLDAAAAAALVVGLGALLFRGPIAPTGASAELLAAAHQRDLASAPGDGTIVLASPEVPTLWAHDRWRGPTYGFNRDDLPAVREARRLLELAAARHSRLWLLAANVPRDDPLNAVERWLDRNAYPVDERSVGAARLRLFLTDADAGPRSALAALDPPMAAFDRGAIQLVGAALPDGAVSTRRPARVELRWRVNGADLRDVNVFVHLYVGGQLVGQRDEPLTRALPDRANAEHFEGDAVGRYALHLARAAEGEASVEVGLYRRTDGARLAAVDGDGALLAENRIPVGRLATE